MAILASELELFQYSRLLVGDDKRMDLLSALKCYLGA